MEKQLYLATYDHSGFIFKRDRFMERLENAEQWLEKYPKFKIGLDNESASYDVFAEESPEIMEKIRKLLEKYPDRFAIGATTYGQPLSVFVSNESNVRQLTYAVRTNLRYFGKTPAVYAISEHALHSQIPQLARGCGYRGALMRTHFMMYGYNPTYSSAFGTWYGDDGTGIPTVPTYTGEGAMFAATTDDNWFLTRWPDQTDESPEDYIRKFAEIEPLLATRYDDSPLRCEGMTSFAEQKENYHWILLEEMFDLYRQTGDEYRPKSEEFVVRMPWGYCANEIWNGCRAAENKVQIVETIDAFASLLGEKSDSALLENAWKNLMIAQHHDVQICGLLNLSRKHIPASLNASETALRHAEKSLAKHLAVGENTMTTVNIHSFPVSDTLEFDCSVQWNAETEKPVVVSDGKTYETEVFPLDSSHNGMISRSRIRFHAEIAPYTAQVFSVSVVKKDDEPEASPFRVSETEIGFLLETPVYTVLLSRDGGIAGLRDKAGIKYLTEDGTGSLFCGMIDGENRVSSGLWLIRCEKLCAEALSRGVIGTIPYEFRMTFDAQSPVIRCRAVFEHHNEIIGEKTSTEVFRQNFNGFIHENKLRFYLRTPFDKTGRCDRPFVMADIHDKYIQGLTMTASLDEIGRCGIAFYNKGAMCAVREDNAVSVPLVFTNEYVWDNRNVLGTSVHEFAIRPIEEFDAAALTKEARAYEMPLHTFTADAAPDSALPEKITFIRPEFSDSAVGSALYVEDGSLFFRVYECAGKSAKIPFTGIFNGNPVPVDLLGRPTEENDPETLSPWQIRTFAVRIL